MGREAQLMSLSAVLVTHIAANGKLEKFLDKLDSSLASEDVLGPSDHLWEGHCTKIVPPGLA